MGDDTKYDRIMNWFKNQWFFVILLFLFGIGSAVFGFFSTAKKGLDTIEEVTGTAILPEASPSSAPAPTSHPLPKSKLIKGQVLDAQGQAIKQARIAIKGLGKQTRYVNSDTEGYFSKELKGKGQVPLSIICTSSAFQKYTLNISVDFDSPEAMDLASITLQAIVPAKTSSTESKVAKKEKVLQKEAKNKTVNIDNKGTIGILSTGDNATFKIQQDFETHADQDTTQQK